MTFGASGGFSTEVGGHRCRQPRRAGTRPSGTPNRCQRHGAASRRADRMHLRWGMAQEQVEDLVARCSRKPDVMFGVRLERQGAGPWLATTAYRLGRPASDAAVSQGDGSSAPRVSGSISLGRSYPGCPGCKQASFVICSCGETACFVGQPGAVHTCPWCGASAPTRGEITSFRVASAGTLDRANAEEDVGGLVQRSRLGESAE